MFFVPYLLPTDQEHLARFYRESKAINEMFKPLYAVQDLELLNMFPEGEVAMTTKARVNSCADLDEVMRRYSRPSPGECFRGGKGPGRRHCVAQDLERVQRVRRQAGRKGNPLRWGRIGRISPIRRMSSAPKIADDAPGGKLPWTMAWPDTGRPGLAGSWGVYNTQSGRARLTADWCGHSLLRAQFREQSTVSLRHPTQNNLSRAYPTRFNPPPVEGMRVTKGLRGYAGFALRRPSHQSSVSSCDQSCQKTTIRPTASCTSQPVSSALEASTWITNSRSWNLAAMA